MISILDTTLREGEQTPGVYFDTHIKLEIADLLSQVGVDIIEAGHPAVTEQICDAVRQLAHRGLRPRIGAHARSLDADVELALDCGVSFLGIFYCVSDARLEGNGTTLHGAIELISRTIRHAREQSPDLMIRYTPEDAVRSPFENVLLAATAAVHAGADVISIADTTGYMIPGTPLNMYDYIRNLREGLARQNAHPRIAVHCHNDRGLALANALDAYRAGASIIDASVLGLGERAGIVDLGTLLAVLRNDFKEGEHWNLSLLPRLYELVSRYAGMPIPANLPVMGENAFTHCAGIHTQAAARNPQHYQSLPPGLVGRRSSIALDHMSGLSSIRACLNEIGEEADEILQRALLRKVKEIGQTGRVVDLHEFSLLVKALRQPSNMLRVRSSELVAANEEPSESFV
jgi:2-isopropylmalate synthase